MSISPGSWDIDFEPNETNVGNWMRGVYEKFQPIEQARWNQSNIDTLFYAGEQRFINSYFNFYPQYNSQQFQFNFIQQPLNMVTGYQRQHRKSISYLPIEGSKQEFADDLTSVMKYANNYRGILEKFSTACEQSAICGMVLIQPWLDFNDDPINGTLDLKVWPYNSFITDSFFRDSVEMSDCNFVWTQQYISKKQALGYFPHRKDQIMNMSGYYNKSGTFYFLPENYSLARNDLLILSYVWYQSRRKKKFLYNRNDGITYEFSDKDEFLVELVQSTGFFEILEIEVPSWKVAVVLNETMMYNGLNPLGFDECPFVPVVWNYDPHMSQYDLRVRSLTRAMRDTQFLLNRRVILNHDISESSINSGWIRKEDSIVNEEDLRYAGQGKDIIVKTGYELSDIQKIVPNAVPPSDMELANQLADFIFRTSGVNQELMGMASDAETGIEQILRQGAGLVTLQKYFDQWDSALKQLGKLEQKIVQAKWSAGKIARILGKQPDPAFLNKLFSKYDVMVAEGINTAVQMQQNFHQILQLNQIIGGVIPARFILENATIHGKSDIIKAVDEQQKMVSEIQQQEAMLKQTLLEAQIQNLQAKSVSDIAMARERHGRAESNIGLFEERLSEISQNRSIALKNKTEALEKLISIAQSLSPSDEMYAEQKLQEMNRQQILQEDIEKDEAKETASSNEFLQNLMQINTPSPNMGIQEETRQALL